MHVPIAGSGSLGVLSVGGGGSLGGTDRKWTDRQIPHGKILGNQINSLTATRQVLVSEAESGYGWYVVASLRWELILWGRIKRRNSKRRKGNGFAELVIIGQ